MRCWRFQLRRGLTRYAHGELKPSRVRKVEEHLFDCGKCRARLARIQSAHRFADLLTRETPVRDPWMVIETALDEKTTRLTGFKKRWPSLKSLLKRPVTAAVISAALCLAVAFSLLRIEGREGGLLAKGAIDRHEFHPVNIADMERTTRPHVVAEGYVSEIKVNDEDGDLSFKLVDDLGQTGPFVVCEIIDPIRIEPPSVGSRVRVYGVSRYDNQQNHNWYEVHPVLNIEVVRR